MLSCQACRLKLAACGLLLVAIGLEPAPVANQYFYTFRSSSPHNSFLVWLFMSGPPGRITTDPRSILAGLFNPRGANMDQGSVLAVRVFGSLSIYFTPQPEVVPDLIV